MAKIDPLLDDVVKRGGTDLHLGGGYSPLVRIRGELVALRDGIVDAKELEEVLFELISVSQRARLQTNLDLEFAHPHGVLARFRCSYFYKSTGLSAVFRLVPQRALTLAELACPEVLWRLAERQSGLVLVTGPTASGKTTTVGAMLDHINKTRPCHILTIEDPAELVHESMRAQVTHREVGIHTVSFASGLRSAARENADVVMVGDITAPAALRQALTLATEGLLVFATMPTNGAVATIDRIVGSFPENEQAQMRSTLADCLVAIVSQQLVRTVDGKGRVAAHEILVGSPAIADLIREHKTGQLTNAMQAGQAVGMSVMDGALERLLSQSRISAQDALDRAVNREQLAQAIARLRPDLAEALG